MPAFVVSQRGPIALATIVLVSVRYTLQVLRQLQSGAQRLRYASLLGMAQFLLHEMFPNAFWFYGCFWCSKPSHLQYVIHCYTCMSLLDVYDQS